MESSGEGELERLIASAKVVEYLEPVMSRDLLGKFPDNTAFGFDYSQSSIWSPLIPRTHHAPADSAGLVTPKRLSCSCGVESKLRSARKKVATSAFRVGLRIAQNIRTKRMNAKTRRKLKPSDALDFSPTPTKGRACVPLAAKGWNKILKAASKQFKKKKKKKDPMAHVELSKYLKSDNF